MDELKEKLFDLRVKLETIKRKDDQELYQQELKEIKEKIVEVKKDMAKFKYENRKREGVRK